MNGLRTEDGLFFIVQGEDENGNYCEQATSQFDDCPKCHKLDNVGIVNISFDDPGFAVLCYDCRLQVDGDTLSEAIENWNTRVESAELTHLREKLAAAEKLLREAVEPGVFGIQDRSRISAPEDEMIRKLGLQIGFGALMDSASRMWAIVAEQDGHPGSEFIVSACAATQKKWVAQVEELLAIIDGKEDK